MKRQPRLGRRLLYFGVLLLLPFAAFSQGPAVVAKIDRHRWPEPVNTLSGFDKASRAAVLVYALQLQERSVSETRSLDRPAVRKWLEKELSRALRNYQFAAKNCTSGDWTCIGNVSSYSELITRASAMAIPPNLNAWRIGIGKFAEDYIGEQVRLAAVFSRTSSEIGLFNSNEWNGDDLGDRQFFLTFDDGPTSSGGNTDGVLEMLAANKKTAVFFMLGQSLKAVLTRTPAAAMANRYQGQCVAMHGWEHLSHEKGSRYAIANEWQNSVTRTESLVRETFATTNSFVPLFRPPYGQRKSDSESFFQGQGLQVALWDLDSQDWNSQIRADEIIDRILTLMLIKRHGVLLFHDVHPKAARALPVIIEEAGHAVDWGDCHQIGAPPSTALEHRIVKFQMEIDLSIFVPGSRSYR